MYISPLILLLSLAATVIALMLSILKKPGFPLLSIIGTAISALYLSVLGLLKLKMSGVSVVTVSQNTFDGIINLLIYGNKASYLSLEGAFFQYSIVLVLYAVLTAVAMVIDIKRIFFGKKMNYEKIQNSEKPAE